MTPSEHAVYLAGVLSSIQVPHSPSTKARRDGFYERLMRNVTISDLEVLYVTWMLSMRTTSDAFVLRDLLFEMEDAYGRTLGSTLVATPKALAEDER